MTAPPPLPSRNGSPSKAARNELTQYYLSSAWKFTDSAVDFLIAKLRGQNIVSYFIADSTYHETMKLTHHV